LDILGTPLNYGSLNVINMLHENAGVTYGQPTKKCGLSHLSPSLKMKSDAFAFQELLGIHSAFSWNGSSFFPNAQLVLIEDLARKYSMLMSFVIRF